MTGYSVPLFLVQSPGRFALKLALKYGLLITAGIIAWVVISHLLVPDPCSPLHKVGPIVFFNLLEAGGIYFGIRDKKAESLGRLQFKSGIKTGVGIACVYGIGSCLFFLMLIAALGSKLMCVPPTAITLPFWQLAAVSFVAQFIFALVGGLIYSTIIAFFLAGRRDA
jgi:hypothetical protein